MDKEELNILSMKQWRETHGSNAYRYAYFDHRLNKWITWDDLDNLRNKRILKDIEMKNNFKKLEKRK